MEVSWNQVSVTYRDLSDWAPPLGWTHARLRTAREGLGLTRSPSLGLGLAAHLTSSGSILGCTQKAWSSGLSLRMADSEGTRAVTRLSAGRVTPAVCSCSVQRDRKKMRAATILRAPVPSPQACPHLHS